MFEYYLPEHNPDNLTDQVGGEVSSVNLSGYLGEVFTHVVVPPEGADGVVQYRKVFIKNAHSFTSTQTRIWLDAVEHPDQISVALGTNTDTIADATTEPSSVTWSTPSNYSDGLTIGDMGPGDASGVWIRQTISGVSESDAYATFRLNIGGIVS